MTQEKLWVVVPMFNEVGAIARVIHEWMACLKDTVEDFTLCVFDDGSNDGCTAVVESLTRTLPQLQLVRKPNSGHGQTCIFAYAKALEAGATYVFQIDSDGQCDPKYFPKMWKNRAASRAHYGYRYQRLDGAKRKLVSQVLRWLIFLSTRTYVKDANVPYRLMHKDSLIPVLPRVPPDFHLANVYVAVLQQREFGIHWYPIVFRDRFSPKPPLRFRQFLSEAIRLLKNIRTSKA